MASRRPSPPNKSLRPTPYVGYNYDETASGGEFTKGLRPTSIRYPNGHLVHYTYGSAGSDAANLNRLDAIKDDNSGSPGNTLASYTYLGADMVVIQDLEEPDVKLDLFAGTSGTYAGLDDFDRVVDQLWHDYGASEDRDRFKYGYDRAANRTWKENAVSKNLATPVYLDEFYTYDGMHRLKNFDRGELNATKTGITGTPSREEDWTLDPLGNWSNYIQKTDGTSDFDQDRTVNKVNEITDITETSGPSWPTPTYDRNGNMTSMPQPADLANNYDCTWDAWNRLVKVKDAATTVADYTYDGQNWRTEKTVSGTTHFYYSSGWQVLEERKDSSTDAERQFIWGLSYVDHLILRDRDNTGNGTLNERLYALQDANWHVTAIADTSGGVLERYSYSAYGVAAVLMPSFAKGSASDFDWRYRYTGRRLDLESALYYYRNRYLHAPLGRFVYRDPIEYKNGQWDLYQYVDADPASSLDPSGLFLVRAGGHRNASGGRGMPAGGVTGTRFTFTAQRGDGPQFIQDVTVTGTLIQQTATTS